MKTVSVVIACYNEQDNVILCRERIKNIFEEYLQNYNYNILFIDNDSKDDTKKQIEQLCVDDPEHISAIFNVRNFGSIRSSVYGVLQAKGDCVVKMSADLQDPPELLLDFVKAWEDGYKIVLGIKEGSDENIIKYKIRELYYKMIRRITEIDHIENFVGYGLYDRQFVEILRSLNDPMPYLRGIVAELGYKHKDIYYHQPKRIHGKSKYNFARLYDYAMLGITSYSKTPLRIVIILGGIVAFLCMAIGLFYFIYKLFNWHSFSVGVAPVIIGIFFISAIQLMAIGIMGEYILNINSRMLDRPLVVEEKRINLKNNRNSDGKIKDNEATNYSCAKNDT